MTIQQAAAPGLVIAAPRSSSGKTTLTLGLLRAFARRGVKVRGLKCGPDYIDPAFHGVAAGRSSLNLDAWAMEPALLSTLAANAGEGAELTLCEGLMGLSIAWRPRHDDAAQHSAGPRDRGPPILRRQDHADAWPAARLRPQGREGARAQMRA